MKAWVISLLMFLAIALTALGFSFAPVTAHVSDVMYGDYMVSGGALTVKGWLEYPQYNIGLGVVSLLGFLGACWSFYNIYKKDAK